MKNVCFHLRIQANKSLHFFLSLESLAYTMENEGEAGYRVQGGKWGEGKTTRVKFLHIKHCHMHCTYINNLISSEFHNYFCGNKSKHNCTHLNLILHKEDTD